MKEARLKEFREYGYVELGESENDETIVAKRHDSGNILIMAVFDKGVTQIRFTSDQFEKLKLI